MITSEPEYGAEGATDLKNWFARVWYNKQPVHVGAVRTPWELKVKLVKYATFFECCLSNHHTAGSHTVPASAQTSPSFTCLATILMMLSGHLLLTASSVHLF